MLTAGVVSGALAIGATPASASVTCPTVDPSTGAVSPVPTPGVDWAGCNLDGADLSGADLAKANLSQAGIASANLENADLAGANLAAANVEDSDATGATFAGAMLATANLDAAIMPGDDLQGANLSGANLYAAGMGNANLTDAILTSTNLDFADLYGANLTGVISGGITGTPQLLPVNWTLAPAVSGGDYLAGPGANLSNTSLVSLTNADLAGADLAHSAGDGLTGANLAGAALTNATLPYLYESNLTNADLTDANLTDSNLDLSTITGANFTGANLTGASGWGTTGTPQTLPSPWVIQDGCMIGPTANLTSCSLANADLSGLDIAGANFTNLLLQGTNFTGANLSSAILTGANMSGDNLTKANLRSAQITGTVFTHVTWADTTCPDGTNSSTHVAGCFSSPIYQISAVAMPRPGSTLPRKQKAIAVIFRLTESGHNLSSSVAAKLAAHHQVKITFAGPGIWTENSYCTWNAKGHDFRGVAAIPRRVKTGRSHRYKITVLENLGTGFLVAPPASRTVNPVQVYFK